MKRFFDLSNGPALAKDYDAVAKRGNIETEFSFIELRDNSRMAVTTHSLLKTQSIIIENRRCEDKETMIAQNRRV
jgi:hypothetical protein